jgi:hypothetical protein
MAEANSLGELCESSLCVLCVKSFNRRERKGFGHAGLACEPSLPYDGVSLSYPVGV